MDSFLINGGNKLSGSVDVNGSKNASLPIITATILNPGIYTLNNMPELRDTLTMAKLLRMIGAEVEFSNNKMIIDTNGCDTPEAPYELVKTMRASFYVLGPLMGRFGYAKVSLPGGCAWGPRPVDYHLKGLERLGATIDLSQGDIIASGKLKGGTVVFEKSSVGATGNILMAAVTADGVTKIVNASREPEIVSLGHFLQKMGAEIKGLGTTEIVVKGTKLTNNNIDFDIIPDRIEAGTFLISGLMTKGSISVNKVDYNDIEIVVDKLLEAGAEIDSSENQISISYNGVINPVDITTAAHPGFPTDLQAQWMALMSISSGDSVIKDDIYTDRFTHIAELKRFGANISLDQNIAVVKGVVSLQSAPVMSTDIRASASLIIAALSTPGKSFISRIYHIDRGYENIESRYASLGADIVRISE